MKSKYFTWGMVLTGMVLQVVPVQAAPLGTAFTYQGQLKQGGVLVDRTASMVFSLWDAAVNGIRAGTDITINSVPVVNGLFTVTLDFGGTAFNGNARWLQAAVNGQTLSPRQSLNPAPYAVTALSTVGIDGHSLDAADGSPVDALFVDSAGKVGIGTTAPTANLTLSGGLQVFDSAAQGIVLTSSRFHLGRVSNEDPIYEYNDADGAHTFFSGGSPSLSILDNGRVGIGISTPDNRLHVFKGSAGTVTADANSPLVVENSTNAYISLLTPDASERGILFGEPSFNVAGGIVYNSPATPDGLLFRTNGNNTRMAIDGQGRVGIGTTAPAAPLEMALGDKRFQIRLDGGLVPGINLAGSGGNLGILRIRNAIEMWPDDGGTRPGKIALANAAGTAFTISLDGGNGSASFTGNLSFGSATRQMLNLWTTEYGIGIQAFTEYFRSGGGFAWFRGGSHNDATNNPGAGGSMLMVLDSSGNLGIGTTSPAAKLDVNGRARVDSLEIVGGADLAEPFEVRVEDDPIRAASGSERTALEGTEAPFQGRLRHEATKILSGMVVVIDTAHPGALKISTEPYDRKVAGILSGANGLPAGMVMRAEGDAAGDGKHPLALSGRVWCWCDAAYGAVTPGDLLTTSATTGHAMRVADDKDAPRGCIIGKAMAALTEGKGLVLVLVNLQ